MKTCNKCGQQRELVEFWKDKRTKDGTQGTCNVCMRETRRETSKHAIISNSTDEFRVCKSCGDTKPLNEFATSPANALGRAWHCKQCDSKSKTVLYHKKVKTVEGWVAILLARVKHRAKKKKLEFNLTTSDVMKVWTDTCPVFGIKLERNGPYAPSLDRIDSSKGYIAGNIIVMSNRANLIKRDSTLNELQSLVSWWVSLQQKINTTPVETKENETI